MTPPGDPLDIFEGFPEYKNALDHYLSQGFADLGDEILAIIRNTKLGDDPKSPLAGEVRRLWSLRLKTGQVLRGMLGTVETRNEKGKTAVFQFLYTTLNDGRFLTALTLGTYDKAMLAAFCKEHGGTPEKGGRS